MTEQKDEKKLLCMPTSMQKESIVEWGQMIDCEDCGAECHIAPSGIQLLDSDPEIKVICWNCFPDIQRMLKLNDEQITGKLNPFSRRSKEEARLIFERTGINVEVDEDEDAEH